MHVLIFFIRHIDTTERERERERESEREKVIKSLFMTAIEAQITVIDGLCLAKCIKGHVCVGMHSLLFSLTCITDILCFCYNALCTVTHHYDKHVPW